MTAVAAAEREFDRQVVLITGASQGIGAATAKEFAIRGARVVVNYCKSKPHAEAVVRAIKCFGGEATAVQADVSSEESVKKLVRTTFTTYGRIDVLVNNAGTVGPMAAFHEVSSSDWHTVMRTNLDSVYYATKEVAQIMVKQGYGRIVNVSSASVNLLPALRSAYNAGKAAVEAITKTFAKEIGRHGITVNAVAPGAVRTASMQGNIARLAHTSGRMMEDLTADLQARCAIGRFCEPEDIAAAIVFLASRKSGAITGAVIEVSGGLM
jgi:3-oxoacyl-[acyl-carrier protein] reductase